MVELMKSLGLLSAHLSEDTTIVLWCWRITRADGEVLGFTDHDRALAAHYDLGITPAEAAAEIDRYREAEG